jgi:hypothetical protein
MCDFCTDFTTWQVIAGPPEASANEETPPANASAARSSTQELNIQLRLIPDEDEHVD